MGQPAHELAQLDSVAAAQFDKLNAKCRRASSVMLTLGLIEGVAGAGVTAIGYLATSKSTADARIYGPVILAIGLVYLGLWLWARRSPLVASVVGFIVFLCIIGTAAVINPSTLTKFNPLKTVVLVVLGSAVYEGFQHRRIQRELRARGAWPNHSPIN
ncbi:MAG: hypothetical protein IT434_02745 [Phycisphaerales bacterium]|nr:hypothetical protein [Phycisphaerales bacterium]